MNFGWRWFNSLYLLLFVVVDWELVSPSGSIWTYQPNFWNWFLTFWFSPSGSILIPNPVYGFLQFGIGSGLVPSGCKPRLVSLLLAINPKTARRMNSRKKRAPTFRMSRGKKKRFLPLKISDGFVSSWFDVWDSIFLPFWFHEEIPPKSCRARFLHWNR